MLCVFAFVFADFSSRPPIFLSPVDDLLAYAFQLDATTATGLDAAWYTCPARNAALFLSQLWSDMGTRAAQNGVPLQQGAFSRNEFRQGLLSSFEILAHDPNEALGGQPIVWLTRASKVSQNSGKALRVRIGANRAPSRPARAAPSGGGLARAPIGSGPARARIGGPDPPPPEAS